MCAEGDVGASGAVDNVNDSAGIVSADIGGRSGTEDGVSASDAVDSVSDSGVL